MRRLHLLLALLVLLLAVLGGVLYWVSEPAPLIPRALLPPPPVEVPAPPEVKPPPEPARPLEITGFVYGPEGMPLEGAQVGVGEEVAGTGPGGAFRLEARRRPRRVDVILSKGGQMLVTWKGALAGDRSGEEGGDEGVAAAPPGEAEGGARNEGPGEEAGQEVRAEATGEDSPGEEAAPPPPQDVFGIGSAEPALPSRPSRIRWAFSVLDATDVPVPRLGLALTQVFVEDWGVGGRIRARGKAGLPDGAHIATSLYFDDFRFLASQEFAQVARGSFESVMDVPPSVRLYSDLYELRTAFNTVAESSALLEQWALAEPDVEWGAVVLPELSSRVYIGDPQEERQDDEETMRYYTAALAEGLQMKRILRARVEEARVGARGWDPALIRAGREARVGWFQDPFIDEEGRFREASWRKFLDEEWRPRLTELRSLHSARIGEKYQEAYSRMDQYWKLLLDESYIYSRFVVYPAFGEKVSERDFYPDEDQLGDLSFVDRLLETNFEALQRFTRL